MSKFIIGQVNRVLDKNLVIEAKCGTEMMVKAFPIFSIQDITEEDEVLLVKVGESTDTYFYFLLRLDEKFYHTYKEMVLGFTSENTISAKAQSIVLEGTDITLMGNLSLKPGKSGGTFFLNGYGDPTPIEEGGSYGPFNCIDICPYTKQKHSTNKIFIKK